MLIKNITINRQKQYTETHIKQTREHQQVHKHTSNIKTKTCSKKYTNRTTHETPIKYNNKHKQTNKHKNNE